MCAVGEEEGARDNWGDEKNGPNELIECNSGKLETRKVVSS